MHSRSQQADLQVAGGASKDGVDELGTLGSPSLFSLPRAMEEAEKTTTTYLDSSTHPAQGEGPAYPSSHLWPFVCLPAHLPAPSGRLTVCVCLSPPPDWAQLDSDSSLFP